METTRNAELALAWAGLGSKVQIRTNRYGAPVYVIGRMPRARKAKRIEASTTERTPVKPAEPTAVPVSTGFRSASIARAMAQVNTWSR